MVTNEKLMELAKMAREIESNTISQENQLLFLALAKVFTDCLEIAIEKTKNSLIENGFTGQENFLELGNKVIFSNGKENKTFFETAIYADMIAIGKEKSFPDIVKVQAKKIAECNDADIKAICEKNSITQKTAPFISVLKLSKKDKIGQ